jgi:hypothetical protein
MNTFNEDRRDDNDEVTMMLNDLPQVDPPSSLARTVMSTITERAEAPVTRPQVTFMRRGSTMAKGTMGKGTMGKRVLWSVAAAAAVALVALRVAGYPPVEEGTEATIGAAQRYQAPQVSAADVKVEDQEFQSFLQSDLFRQLVNDKAAQEALKNPDLQRALADVNVRNALSNDAIRYVISNNAKAWARYTANNDVIANLRLDAKNMAILHAALTASPALVAAISNVHVADAISNSNLAKVLANSEALVAVRNQAVLNAMFNASSNARFEAVNEASSNAKVNAINK